LHSFALSPCARFSFPVRRRPQRRLALASAQTRAAGWHPSLSPRAPSLVVGVVQIELASSSTVRASPPARFHVSAKSGRVYDLEAASPEERDVWVESVRQVVYGMASAAAQRG
jgi:hypothetical protein